MKRKLSKLVYQFFEHYSRFPARRVDDNSIKSPTLVQTDNYRFVYKVTEDGVLEWSYLSGKINKFAYIIITDFGHPVCQLFGAECDLTLSPVWAKIYPTYEIARKEITRAINQCKKANPNGSTELFDSLEVIQINVAKDELKHKFMRKDIAMRRRNKTK